jgi:hypothetical protein
MADVMCSGTNITVGYFVTGRFECGTLRAVICFKCETLDEVMFRERTFRDGMFLGDTFCAGT